MKRNIARKNLIQSFVMLEFASNHLNTQQDVSRMINLIEKKLQMSNAEARGFLRESIGLCEA